MSFTILKRVIYLKKFTDFQLHELKSSHFAICSKICDTLFNSFGSIDSFSTGTVTWLSCSVMFFMESLIRSTSVSLVVSDKSSKIFA